MKACLKFFLLLILIPTVLFGQDKTPTSAVGPCVCCALGEAPPNLSHITQLAPDSVKGTRIIIKGKVLQSDGKTPAENVTMYFYHTNAKGVYAKATTERNTQAWFHGYNRGWLKTNKEGEYEIHTIRPAAYPSRTEPAHIHAAVQSPNQTMCYGIHDYVFTDDPLVTGKFWYRWELQGLMRYSGVELKTNAAGVPEGTRDIVLLPRYDQVPVNSGPLVGEDCPAFDPHHVSGPDKGSTACPMCKYGHGQGVMAWINTDNFDNVKRLAIALENEIKLKGTKKIRAFIIYMNPKDMPTKDVEKLLSDFSTSAGLKQVAVTYIPNSTDLSTATLYKINPNTAIRNTMLVYRSRVITNKYVNFDASADNIVRLLSNISGSAPKRK